MAVSWIWSKAFLTSRAVLWLLFVFNAAGTVYGYEWYWQQMEYTAASHPVWQLPFVPDSPTASLFFTVSLLFLLFPPANPSRLVRAVRSLLEALAVLTCVKYGIWAVAMNVAQQAQGEALDWQNWMLIVSHGAMAVEALLFVRFFTFGRTAAFAALVWLLLNDIVDYTYGVYPWLSQVLEDDVPVIRNFTFGLTAASFLAASLARAYRDLNVNRNRRLP